MDSQRQKIVNLAFIIGAALTGYVFFALAAKFAGIYDLEARVQNIDLLLRGGSIAIGLGLFIYFYKSDKTNQYMNEVVAELARVTWPTQKDTNRATVVVIIMVLISGFILGGFDAFWSWLLKFIIN